MYWLPKNTVLQLPLSRFVNVSGWPKMDSNGPLRHGPLNRKLHGHACILTNATLRS